MLTRRIIACLDVSDGMVVKGVRFRNHQVLGEVVELAQRYRDQGIDELVFYDITASGEGRSVDKDWVERCARVLDIPFCVAGGIGDLQTARQILNAGCDKISVNSPALERPELITELAETFGSQCIVVGIDSMRSESGALQVWSRTGKVETAADTQRSTMEWAQEAVSRGAGELVLNCMNSDGTKAGYDLGQLRELRECVAVPLIASGGAGCAQDFADVFALADVDGALAAGIFHRGETTVGALKSELLELGVCVRMTN